MRKLSWLIAILAIICVVSTASAEVLEVTIESATVTTDKNGREYVRLIIPIQKTESGISYELSVPAMAFSKGNDASLVDYAKTLKAGDKVKFAASKRIYQGRESYTIHKFVTE
jgi:hypothetical protein